MNLSDNDNSTHQDFTFLNPPDQAMFKDREQSRIMTNQMEVNRHNKSINDLLGWNCQKLKSITTQIKKLYPNIMKQEQIARDQTKGGAVPIGLYGKCGHTCPKNQHGNTTDSCAFDFDWKHEDSQIDHIFSCVNTKCVSPESRVGMPPCSKIDMLCASCPFTKYSQTSNGQECSWRNPIEIPCNEQGTGNLDRNSSDHRKAPWHCFWDASIKFKLKQEDPNYKIPNAITLSFKRKMVKFAFDGILNYNESVRNCEVDYYIEHNATKFKDAFNFLKVKGCLIEPYNFKKYVTYENNFQIKNMPDICEIVFAFFGLQMSDIIPDTIPTNGIKKKTNFVKAQEEKRTQMQRLQESQTTDLPLVLEKLKIKQDQEDKHLQLQQQLQQQLPQHMEQRAQQQGQQHYHLQHLQHLQQQLQQQQSQPQLQQPETQKEQQQHHLQHLQRLQQQQLQQQLQQPQSQLQQLQQPQSQLQQLQQPQPQPQLQQPKSQKKKQKLQQQKELKKIQEDLRRQQQNDQEQQKIQQQKELEKLHEDQQLIEQKQQDIFTMRLSMQKQQEDQQALQKNDHALNIEERRKRMSEQVICNELLNKTKMELASLLCHFQKTAHTKL